MGGFHRLKSKAVGRGVSMGWKNRIAMRTASARFDFCKPIAFRRCRVPSESFKQFQIRK
jgi:hypothetical protein